jgi:16S rRNA (cytosine1402-N4)-methyltransferase
MKGMAMISNVATLSTVDHVPVMAEEIVNVLESSPPEVFFDGTLGLGGHCKILLDRFPEIRHYIGVDIDEHALARARILLAPYGDRVSLFHGSYEDIDRFVHESNAKPPEAILVDLGASTMQLKDSDRGFSFSGGGPLDMRMDQSNPLTALELIKQSSAAELQTIFSKYGEFKYSGRVARALADLEKIPETTSEFAEFVSSCLPVKYVKTSKKHPATQVFQALRIAVNDELNVIERSLPKLFSALSQGGLLLALSFHSLEDRLVKQFMRDGLGRCVCSKKMPLCICGARPVLELFSRRPLCASPEEIERNRPSRSAKLRVARKL